MTVTKDLTATIGGVLTTIPVRAWDGSAEWDGPCVEPDGSTAAPRPVPLTPAQIAGMTWEDVWVGPGHSGTPAGRTYSSAATGWEDMLADLSAEGITTSDHLRVNGVPGSTGMWAFNTVTDPDVGQASTVVISGDERGGTGWTLVQPDDVSGLPTPDANVKGVVATLASRIDPTGDLATGERSKLLWIERQATAAHVIVVGLGARNIQFRGIMTRPRAGDSHPVVYHVTMPSDPTPANIPDQIHFQQCVIDGGGIDFDHNNGCTFGIVTRADNCSVTDSYICGISGPAGRESKALVHGCGNGFLSRNNFLQASGINAGAGFQSTTDRRVRARSSSWEWCHSHKEIQSTNGPYVSKGSWECKGLEIGLIEGWVHENMTVGANAVTSDASNTQLIGFKGFNDTLGVNAKSSNLTARFCFGDGCLKMFYIQHIGASGGYTSWGVQRASIHDILCINHGGEAGAASGTTFNPSGDVSTYENNSTIGTFAFGGDPDSSRTGPYRYEVRGLTVVNNSAGTVPPTGGGAPTKHFMYLGDTGPGYLSTDCAMTDIIGPPTYWGMWGVPGGNVNLDAGGSMENTDVRFIAGGLVARTADGWFPHGNMATYLGSDGMLTAAGATAWRSAAGLGGSAPICTQVPRKHPDGTTFTPAADKPGCDVPKLAALIGGTYPNLGSAIKSPTILYP